jgi:hypothetical protein
MERASEGPGSNEATLLPESVPNVVRRYASYPRPYLEIGGGLHLGMNARDAGDNVEQLLLWDATVKVLPGQAPCPNLLPGKRGARGHEGTLSTT